VKKAEAPVFWWPWKATKRKGKKGTTLLDPELDVWVVRYKRGYDGRDNAREIVAGEPDNGSALTSLNEHLGPENDGERGGGR